MNRKLYEAVPLDEWMKQPHETGYYTVMNGLDDKFMGQVYYSNSNIEFGNKSDCTHVLVAVEEVDKWISVEDRLPEQPKGKDVKYLTYPNFEVLPFWSGVFWRYSNYTDSHIAEKQITHWQPLPSAPKQDKEQLCDCGYACNPGTNICSKCNKPKPTIKQDKQK